MFIVVFLAIFNIFLPLFWFCFVSPFYFCCVMMQAFSFYLVGVNYCSNWCCAFVFRFCSHLHFLLSSCHLCLRLHLLLTTCWHGVRFCISPSLQPHHIYMVLVFTSHVHHFCFCIANVLVFLLPFFTSFFFCVNLLFFWNYLVVSLIFVFDLCNFLCVFVLFLHFSEFLGFFYLMCCVGAICLNFKLCFLF